MITRFSKESLNKLCYQVLVVFEREPTHYYYYRNKSPRRVRWQKTGRRFEISINSSSSVILTIILRKLTQPYINRMCQSKKSSFINILTDKDSIVYDNGSLLISSPKLDRSLKIAIAFLDSSIDAKLNFRLLTERKISMTTLLRMVDYCIENCKCF